MSKSFGIQANAALAGLGVGSRKAGNTGGALVNVRYTDVFAAPHAASTDAASCHLITPVAVSDSAGATGVVIAQPDFPRNLVVFCTAANTGDVTLTGLDQFGNAISEVIAANGAAVVAGTKVFAVLSTVTSANRSAGATTLSVGVGSILGSSRMMNSLGIDGAVYTTSSGATTAVQETTRPVKAPTANVHGVTFATALADTKTYLLAYGSSEAR
jgi:hypothetical protein